MCKIWDLLPLTDVTIMYLESQNQTGALDMV